MDDPYNLKRFLDAQNSIYDQVCTELRQGRKSSHWMWFIFPQIQGLGHSSMAKKFALASLAKAQAYLQHSILGPRLLECAQWVVQTQGRTIHEILGHPDDLKFFSSMTLFVHAAPDNALFKDALQKYFGAQFDPLTLEQLSIS